MPASYTDIPPVVNLSVKKGDLVIKEGDFGVSLYKILGGRIHILKEKGNKEVLLTTLGPGEIFGEMALLNRGSEVRSASARAAEDIDLEVWHVSRFTKEFQEMPPMMKLVAKQMVRHLIKVSNTMAELGAKTDQVTHGPIESPSSKRRYVRRKLNRSCTYRPSGAPKDTEIPGRINDISLLGLGLDVSASFVRRYNHKPGDEIEISAKLPNNQDIKMVGKIISLKPSSLSGRTSLGVEFTELIGESKKRIGFFLMS